MQAPLSAFREVRHAFSTVEKPIDSTELRAADVAMRSGFESLGFKKRKKAPRGGEGDLKRLVEESGISLSAEQLKNVLDYLGAVHDKSMARRRFYVQAAVSAAIILFAILLLTLAHVKDEKEKALFGLLGTVLGYWLH